MNKFWLALLLVLLFPRPVSAVDLSIRDPIINNLEITVIASLSATSNYYLQGALRSQSSSRYFGETQNKKGDWIDYVATPDKEYIVSNFFVTDVQNATWSGMVKLRFKLDDPNYLGPGLYDLKLRRFTGGSSSSAGESNTLSFNLTAVIPTPTPSPSPSPSPTPSSPTPSPSPVPSPSPAGSPAPSVVLKDEVGSPPPVGTVAGESTEIDLSGFGVSPSPVGADYYPPVTPTINKSRVRIAITAGSSLILLAIVGLLAYRKYLATISK